MAGPARKSHDEHEDTVHFLVPERSMRDGVLVQAEYKDVGRVRGGQHAYLPTYSQVLLSKKDSRRVRVLAVKDLFDCIELCLMDDEYEPIPRPVGAIPGLAVTHALMGDDYSPNRGYLQTVECFLYPGSGQTIVTAGSPDYKQVVEVGLMWVKQQWSNLLKWHKGEPRLTPFDKTYDLHVNVPSGIWAPLDGNIALAAAAGYLSLLTGKGIPSGVAFFAAVHIEGSLRPSLLTKGCLGAAIDGAITTIFAAESKKSELETFLSSCPEAKGAGVTFQYLNEADDVYAYLVTSELTDLPPLPVLPDATSDELCTSDTEDSTEGEEMEDC